MVQKKRRARISESGGGRSSSGAPRDILGSGGGFMGIKRSVAKSPSGFGRTVSIRSGRKRIIYDPKDLIKETPKLKLTSAQATKAAKFQRDAMARDLRASGRKPKRKTIGKSLVIEFE